MVTDNTTMHTTSMFEYIVTRFNEHIDLSSRCIEPLVPAINDAISIISQSMLQQAKVLCAGSLDSALVARQFCHYMQHHYKYERPALPVVDLCAIELASIEKNLHSLAQKGDVVLFFQHPNCKFNLNAMISTCRQLGLKTIICNGIGNSQNYLSAQEIYINIPSQDVIGVLEIQWLIMHTVCELIDLQLFNYKG